MQIQRRQIFLTLFFVVSLGFFFSPWIFGSFYELKGSQWWIWSWLLLFAWFILSRQRLDVRSIVLIMGSIFLVVAGKTLLLRSMEPPSMELLDIISQVMLIMGGSVGANVFSQTLIDKNQKKKPAHLTSETQEPSSSRQVSTKD